MSTKRKPTPSDTRPFWTVGLEDAKQVHRAIADGLLAMNVAPIDLFAAARWAHENIMPDCGPEHKAHGLKFTIKEPKP